MAMYTSHYDPSRAFAETKDGTFPVRVHGDFLPRQVLGMFHILFAILRSLYLAVAVALGRERYDVFVVDQVSVRRPPRVLQPLVWPGVGPPVPRAAAVGEGSRGPAVSPPPFPLPHPRPACRC